MNREVTGAAMDPETSDFLFNRRDLKVLSKYHVRHVPWCISFGFEAFKDFNIGGRKISPELYVIGPDRFENDLVQ
jgi:hypothetical protein